MTFLVIYLIVSIVTVLSWAFIVHWQQIAVTESFYWTSAFICLFSTGLFVIMTFGGILFLIIKGAALCLSTVLTWI